MIEQIIFTVLAFLLFLYILWFKLIKKNDTTYLIILTVQAIGILMNLIRINYDILKEKSFGVLINIFCIAIPILVIVLEIMKKNIAELLKIVIARIWIWIDNTKKAKKILQDLIKKYPDSIKGHKLLAYVYEMEGR